MIERIAGEVTVYQPISILEIGESGMRIEAAFPLQNDSLREFRLILSTRSVVVRGRVVRCEIGELREGVVLYQCRIEFVDPPAHTLTAINEFLAIQQPPATRVVDGEITGSS